jgi:hypothetical protein
MRMLRLGEPPRHTRRLKGDLLADLGIIADLALTGLCYRDNGCSATAINDIVEGMRFIGVMPACGRRDVGCQTRQITPQRTAIGAGGPSVIGRQVTF